MQADLVDTRRPHVILLCDVLTTHFVEQYKNIVFTV